MSKSEMGWRKPYRKELQKYASTIETQRRKLINTTTFLRASLDVLALALCIEIVFLFLEGRGKLIIISLVGIILSIILAHFAKQLARTLREGADDAGGEDVRVAECTATKALPLFHIVRANNGKIAGFFLAGAERDGVVTVTGVLAGRRVYALGTARENAEE